MSARFPAAVLPVAGALLGLCGGLLILVLPKGPGAVAALALWTAATLASGERGISRWFTKLRLFGSLIGGLTILVRWYALISLHTPSRRLLTSAIVALALGQAASVALGWVSRPVDNAAVARLALLTSYQAIAAMGFAAAAAIFAGLPMAAVLVLAAYVLIRLVSWYSNWRFGGVRGSDLEAQRVLVETASLAILASVATGA